MRKATLPALCILLGLIPSAAEATGNINCFATDESGATVDILLGAGPARVPIDVSFFANGQTRSTIAASADTKITLFQSFDETDRLSIDLTDDNVNNLVATIRLISSEEGKDVLEVGILRVVSDGTLHALKCEGP